MALSAPLTAVHFGSVSVVSPISNILCLWIVSAVYIGGYIIVRSARARRRGAGRKRSRVGRAVYLRGVRLPRASRARTFMRNPLFFGWLALVYALFFAAWVGSRKTGRFRALAPICVSLAPLFAAAGITRLNERYAPSHGARRRAGGMHRSHGVGEHAAVIDCGGSWVTHDAGKAPCSFGGEVPEER